MGRDFIRGHIPEKLLRTFQAFPFSLPYTDESAIGQSIDGHLGLMGIGVPLAITIEYLSDPGVASQEHGADVPVLGNLHS